MKNKHQIRIDFVRAFPEAILTGSYFFGNENKQSSDMDFFIDKQSIDCNVLKEFGFNLESNSTYQDSQLVSVWIHEQGMIHLQIVEDASLKIRAQDFLKCLPIMLRLAFLADTKCGRSKTWDWAYKMVEGRNL